MVVYTRHCRSMSRHNPVVVTAAQLLCSERDVCLRTFTIVTSAVVYCLFGCLFVELRRVLCTASKRRLRRRYSPHCEIYSKTKLQLLMYSVVGPLCCLRGCIA